MLIHLLSTKQQGKLVSTRWIDEDGVVYEIPLTAKLEGGVLTFDLEGIDEVLYVPPYGTSTLEIDLSEALTAEGKTKRGDRLVRVVGGAITIDDVSIKLRKVPAVPKLARPEAHETVTA